MDFLTQNKINPEVYHSKENFFSLNKHEINKLINLAKKNPRNRVRFCSHSSDQDTLHEMFIVHPKDIYVRPHMHRRNAESLLVLDGEADYVTFNEEGEIENKIVMGDYTSGHQFYQNTAPGVFHTILVRSEWLVFLECTLGPFNKDDMVYPNWSPAGSDTDEVNMYVSHLLER